MLSYTIARHKALLGCIALTCLLAYSLCTLTGLGWNTTVDRHVRIGVCFKNQISMEEFEFSNGVLLDGYRLNKLCAHVNLKVRFMFANKTCNDLIFFANITL